MRVNFNLSIFDGGLTDGRQGAERAELSRLQLELIDLQKGIRVEVRRAYREVANAKERTEIEEKRVQIFEQRLRTIERVLDEGLDLPSYRGLTFDDAFQAKPSLPKRSGYSIARVGIMRRQRSNCVKCWGGQIEHRPPGLKV